MTILDPKRWALRHLGRDAAPELGNLQRRLFLRQSLSLGALSLLTGCSATTPSAVNGVLDGMLKFNDWAQGLLFNPRQLAPTYGESDITTPFPFNAYYSESEAPVIDGVPA